MARLSIYMCSDLLDWLDLGLFSEMDLLRGSSLLIDFRRQLFAWLPP